MTVPATTHLRSTVSTGSGVVAHRGASAEFPELTLVAYEKALEQGAEALEVDVRLTSDGVPVLLHDPRTARVADRDVWVHSSTLDELSALDLGSWHPVHRRPEPLLTLRSLLVMAEAYPHVKLFLETKHPVPTGGRVEVALRDELRYFGLDRPASHAESRALMMSFSVMAVRRFRQLAPQVPTVQLRERGNVLKSWPAEGFGAQLMGPSIGALRARPWLVEYWRSRGMGTYCWTVDDPADMLLCRDLGVEWVATNVPTRARGVLDGPTRRD
ncbi:MULTISPECIES: glycerophosphodiester phosphodiesterase family protein [Dietzia]|uniref:Glycerophosphodiester phosphodiesterase n=1 Tax=Dietzia cercidiphylli TaxID=498199 RepID=A0ABP4V3T9_9ACTN|nr:glycerophosphodiester phosphodiesterase [Dietzia sp. Cai40]MBB1045642.1 glycerophosphodiester phosphodiesterase [Dietzia sp. DQ11-44]MBB1048216.1 glycerophosphodiester phosphodiesterase [Dietzia cercidiphylli]